MVVFFFRFFAPSPSIQAKTSFLGKILAARSLLGNYRTLRWLVRVPIHFDTAEMRI